MTHSDSMTRQHILPTRVYNKLESNCACAKALKVRASLLGWSMHRSAETFHTSTAGVPVVQDLREHRKRASVLLSNGFCSVKVIFPSRSPQLWVMDSNLQNAVSRLPMFHTS